MADKHIITPIAYIETDFKDKFGIPRQSGMVGGLTGIIRFLPEFDNEAALKGLDGYSHIWLIWQFSQSLSSVWRPTVRPPRLGGNKRMGVFATRSPFRPNSLGLSAVKLEKIERLPKGSLLIVSGIDLADKTPIYDIKPYLPFSDSIPEASPGFSGEFSDYRLEVVIDRKCTELSDQAIDILTEVLSLDPRPSYIDDPDRIYGMSFAGMEVSFRVQGKTLTVVKIEH